MNLSITKIEVDWAHRVLFSNTSWWSCFLFSKRSPTSLSLTHTQSRTYSLTRLLFFYLTPSLSLLVSLPGSFLFYLTPLLSLPRNISFSLTRYHSRAISLSCSLSYSDTSLLLSIFYHTPFPHFPLFSLFLSITVSLPLFLQMQVV